MQIALWIIAFGGAAAVLVAVLILAEIWHDLW